MSDKTDTLVRLLMANTGALRDLVTVEVFNVADLITREILQLPGPVFASGIDTWFTAPQWDDYFHFVKDGVLARLHATPGKPWSNPALAGSYEKSFEAAYDVERSQQASILANAAADARSRLVVDLRANLRDIQDDQIGSTLFDTVNELAVSDFFLTLPVPVAGSDPSTWLNPTQWTSMYPLLFEGVLARAMAQPDLPWGNVEGAKLHMARWADLLTKFRDDAVTAATNSYDRIVKAVRLRANAIHPVQVTYALYETLDFLYRNLWPIPQPDVTAPPSAWLTATQWSQFGNALEDGVLERVFLMPGKAWSDDKLSTAHGERFAKQTAMEAKGLYGSAALADVVQAMRVVEIVRGIVPMARLDVIRAEMFDAIDEAARNVLPIPAPVKGSDPTLWLPAAKWDAYFPWVREATLGRVLAQPGAPWFDANGATAHAKAASALLVRLRDDEYYGSMAEASAYAQLLAKLRVGMPDIKDNVLLNELFAVVDDLARTVLAFQAPDPALPSPGWLDDPQWARYAQVLEDGTMARCMMMQGQAWTDKDMAAAHKGKFDLAVSLMRSADWAGEAVLDTSWSQRLLHEVRAILGGVRDDIVNTSMFDVIQDLSLTSVPIPPPMPGTDPATYMADDDWAVLYGVVLAGVLARLCGMDGEPWASATESSWWMERWKALLYPVAQQYNASKALADTTAWERIVHEVVALAPLVRPDMVRVELFDVIDTLSRTRLPVPSPVKGSPPQTWLPASAWDAWYPALVAGTVSRVFAMAGAPWFDAETAKGRGVEFDALVDVLRNDASYAATVAATGYDLLLSKLRYGLPQARDNVLVNETWEVIDDLSRTALPIQPPTYGEPPASWLTEAQWREYAQVIEDGVLARAMSDLGQPWSNADMATAHGNRFAIGVTRLVSQDFSTLAVADVDGSQRLLHGVRAQVPSVPDNTVWTALFDLLTELSQTQLPIPAPVMGSAPSAYLTAEDWANLYQCILEGVMARLCAQVSMPWGSKDALPWHVKRHADLLVIARDSYYATDRGAITSPTQRLRITALNRIPSVTDGVLLTELYDTVDEWCRTTLSWTGLVTLPLVAGVSTYALAYPGATIIQVNRISHKSIGLVHNTYDPAQGLIDLGSDPNGADAMFPAYVEVALTLTYTAADDPDTWMTPDLWETYTRDLLYGVQARLHDQSAKPYTDKKTAHMERVEFSNGMLKARNKTQQGGVPGNQLWHYPGYARSRNRGTW